LQKNITLPRAISLIENEGPGFRELLLNAQQANVPVIGITGPPGAGKSTLTDALIGNWVAQGKKIGVLCVDPSSPFHRGALLGDRIRMSNWYLHPNVFIRSLASRGALGGLHPKIIEITEYMKSAGFDYIITETVGVGQSEIEISRLADLTLLVLVPEAGDEVQTLKSGIMEVADFFVVNKSDRPDADLFTRHLKNTLSADPQPRPVFQCIASQQQGISEICTAIEQVLEIRDRPQHFQRQAEKAFQLIQRERMRNVDLKILEGMFREGAELMEVVKRWV